MEMLVYFNSDTGHVSAVTNEVKQNSELAMISVKFSEVENLLNGVEILNQYRVVLNSTTKTYNLIKVSAVDLNLIRDCIFKIPVCTTLEANTDLVIVQDSNCKKWIININHAVYQTLLKTESLNLNRVINIYVTNKNDPNVLRGVLSFNVNQFDNGSIEIDSIDIDSDVSLYCRKYFTSYTHIIK